MQTRHRDRTITFLVINFFFKTKGRVVAEQSLSDGKIIVNTIYGLKTRLSARKVSHPVVTMSREA